MDTAFSHEIRVIACDNCGAPVQATPAAGHFQCDYCRAVNVLQVRQQQTAPAPQQAGLHEGERLRRLRTQQGRGLATPPDLMHLSPGGLLVAHKVNEAGAIWQTTRNALRANPADFAAAERLVYLTMMMSTYYQAQRDLLRQRAMLESALEVVTTPRHQQMMRGYLSRCACRSGDLQSAEQWLTPCDPRSDDLETDTAYRYSRACIDTAAGNFQGVLEVLGTSPTDVPLMTNLVHVCAVLRANAWEKLGNLPMATQLLAQALSSGAPMVRAGIDKIVQIYADWGVCAQSYPQVRTRYPR
ncbi:MAG: hypothetical protein JRI23_28960 [Deltaproteobacteria bacterium]|jgi:hypothetical protein|nr:hypothetical protein [Deltaproteobacteria bacterium]MBW2536159.1 hypothetical protein [Deltaproteobacteria bacterium]